MRILIAPDKFKGSLSAREVAENIAAGIGQVLPDAKIDVMPLADGGEGTAEVICDALGGAWRTCRAHGPLGREIEALYAFVDDRELAIMEMSEAAGMRRLRPNEYNVDLANSFGVGEMLLDAVRRGAGEIIIGLGGSATNDGGFGMARALGFEFFPVGAKLDGFKPSSLQELERIDRPHDLKLSRIVAAVDVRNPLLGENGATRVFGPQKGATPDKIEMLERALARLADIVAKEFGFDYRNEPGAGAAGGLGFGLMSFCGAKIRPGFDVVAEAVGLEAKMQDVDLVITGEGSLDRQTLEGKTPAGVARLARKRGKPVFAFVGRAVEDRQVRELFNAVYENARPGMSDAENMQRAPELLRENARELAGRCNAR
jgi:glycerate kinase